MADKIGFMNEEALKRKERLANLKRKYEGSDNNNDNQPKEQPRPKFRSYKPLHDSLKENALEDTKPGDVEAEVQDVLAAAKSKVVVEELDISSLAPRKPDWDLKRDIAKKLEKLERRTEKAMAELIIERLRENPSQNLAEVVNSAADFQSTSPTS